MKPSDLLGSKATHQPLRAWLKTWSNGVRPTPNIVIVTGASGVGKTTLVTTLSEAVGLHPQMCEVGNLKASLAQANTPTFLGQRRLAILDDSSFLSRREWKDLEKTLSLNPIPLVLIAESERDVAWPIRRGALVIRTPPPTRQNLIELLALHTDRLGLPHDEADWNQIADVASTWRAAILRLRTSPHTGGRAIAREGARCSAEHSHDAGTTEERRILAGHHAGRTISVHPMAILSAAEFNGANPNHVEVGNRLHSWSWESDDLTRVAHDYLTTLRASTQDRVPFRQRTLRGSVKRLR